VPGVTEGHIHRAACCYAPRPALTLHPAAQKLNSTSPDERHWRDLFGAQAIAPAPEAMALPAIDRPWQGLAPGHARLGCGL